MKQFKIWDGTTMSPKSTEFTPGIRDVQIKDASINPENFDYSITLVDLEMDKEIKLKYWLKKTDGTENETSKGPMFSLGRAIYGEQYDPKTCGILAACDIIGAIVKADIKESSSKSTGNIYPAVYRFLPGNPEYEEYSTCEGQQFEN